MKQKRLTRDGWGFQGFPYYQMRLDTDDFHGMVCVIRLLSGDYYYWQTEKAGRLAVCGEGMTWLQLIPDGKKRVITVKYFKDGTCDTARKNYPAYAHKRYRPSVWYVDVIDGFRYDEDGVIVYIDKYLDVIFTPEGDVKVDDRDELDAARESGELSEESYLEALAEGESILNELTLDIEQTATVCARIREAAEEKIKKGECFARGVK